MPLRLTSIKDRLDEYERIHFDIQAETDFLGSLISLKDIKNPCSLDKNLIYRRK